MMMVRSRSACILIITLCICAVVLAMAAEGPRVFKVGDEFGWRVPLQNDSAVYSNWASTNRFHIGDSLSFVYDKLDSVMEVDKWGFYHCNGSDPIIAFDNGNSTLILDRPGLFYFISGSKEHCTRGQRLIVEVMHIHSHDRHSNASMPPSMSPLPASSMPPSMSPLPASSMPSSMSPHSASPLTSAASTLLAAYLLPPCLACGISILFLFSAANHI